MKLAQGRGVGGCGWYVDNMTGPALQTISNITKMSGGTMLEGRSGRAFWFRVVPPDFTGTLQAKVRRCWEKIP